MKISQITNEDYYNDQQIVETAALFQALALRHTMLVEGRLDEAGVWDIVKGTVGGVMKGIKSADDAVNKLGRLAGNTKPVENFDAKADQIVANIKGKLNPKVAATMEKYVEWAKKNPIKQGLIIGAITAIAALVTGGFGAAGVGFILQTTNKYMKGEKLSTAMASSAKTMAVGAAVGALANMGLDQIGSELRHAIPSGPRPYDVKGLSTLTVDSTVFGHFKLTGPEDMISKFHQLQSQAFNLLDDDPKKAAGLIQQMQTLADQMPKAAEKVIAANSASKAAAKAAWDTYMDQAKGIAAFNDALSATVDQIKKVAGAGVAGAAASGLAGKAAGAVKGAAGAVANKFRDFVPSKTYNTVSQQIKSLQPADKQKLVALLQQELATA